MGIDTIAHRLVELCRSGQYEQAQKELFHDKAVSIEPSGAPMEVTNGLPGILKKNAQWANLVEEIHSREISDPLISSDHFAVTMINDVTFKEMGRHRMEEVCVYEVKNDKIIKEQFFYTPSLGQS